MKILLATILAILAFQSQAMIDLSQYDLTELQIELMHRFEKKGWSDEKLHKVAGAFHRSNNTQRHEVYIPPHTPEMLDDIVKWAAGGAFAAMIQYTSYSFKTEEYKEDCPSWAVFNFGRATGNQHLKVFVTSRAESYMHVLQNYLIKDRDNFEEHFIRLAKDSGMDIYLEKN